MNAVVHRPVEQIARDLNALKAQRLTQLPNIEALELAVQRWTTEATLDEAFKEELRSAVNALRDAKSEWDNRAKLNTQIATMEMELSDAEFNTRRQLIETADRRLSTALDEYQHACLIAARSLRALMNASKQSAQVPGARFDLQHMRLHQFNLPSLMPMAWSGTLGLSMQAGLMPWEKE